jgi:hypothetical protein
MTLKVILGEKCTLVYRNKQVWRKGVGFEDAKGLAREPIKRATRMNENNQYFLSMSRSLINTSTRRLNLHILRKLTSVAERCVGGRREVGKPPVRWDLSNDSQIALKSVLSRARSIAPNMWQSEETVL